MAAAESDVLDSFRKDVSRASMRGKGVMTLEGVLSDSVELKYFKEYCIKEMSVEKINDMAEMVCMERDQHDKSDF